MKYITDYLTENAHRYPDKPAIVTADTSLTWQQLFHKVEPLTGYFSAIRPQQSVVAVLLPNGWEFIAVYLAAVRAGHIVMPLDPTFKQLEIKNQINQIPPAVIVTNRTYQGLFEADARVVLADELLSRPAAQSVVKLALPPERQVVSLLFTSGTTGKPKATPYTHRNHLWNIAAVSELWQWTAQDSLLVSLPLSHWHGLVMGVTGALYHANTLYVREKFDAAESLQLLHDHAISLFMHVPIAYYKLAEYDGAIPDLSRTRLFISGSSYLPPEIWQQVKQKYGKEILERYGASEMGLLASNRLDDRRPGSVGWLLDGVEARIEPDGQLAMRSPGLFPGYYKNQAATVGQQTRDGYWLSGDIAEFSPDGRLWLKGRIQEKMKKMGYTVYPRDIEWAVLQHPKVQDIVVMGRQHETSLSDEFVYFVVTTLSDSDLLAYCRANLPAYWRPDRIVQLDELPKTRSGKPVLAKLRDMI